MAHQYPPTQVKATEEAKEKFFRKFSKTIEICQDPKLWEEEKRHRLEWGIDPPLDMDLEAMRKEAEKNLAKDMELFEL